MRWQPIAKKVCDGLFQSNCINQKEHIVACELIDRNEAANSFQYLAAHQKSSSIVGWNKAWQGHNQLVWYGSMAFQQPMRLIAMEIESKPESCLRLRSYLNDKYHENCYQADLEIEALLISHGFRSADSQITNSQLRLLQRLNADRRERPIIERWRWSKNDGIAYLSDGGQASVTLNFVWSRAIESSVSIDSKYSKIMLDFISNISPKQSALNLPMEVDSEMMTCLDTLKFYGVGHMLDKTFRMKIPAGEFPEIFSLLIKSKKIN